MPSDHDADRRRHTRLPKGVTVRLEIDAASAAPPPARLIDVSLGGAFLELSPDAERHALPALHGPCRAILERDGISVTRRGRVVRLRLAGREKGTRVPPAIALVWDDGDDEAARALERLLRDM